MAETNVTEIRRRRTYAGEEEWFPLLEQLGPIRLRRGFIASGVSAAVAGSLVWTIADQWSLDRHQDARTRQRHRQILRSLDPVEVARKAGTTTGLCRARAV